MKDDDPEVKSTETPAPAPPEQGELSDDQLEGIAGGISSEPVYSVRSALPLNPALGGLINPASVLTIPRDVLAGK
ncbi:MAG: hypothetical protein NTY02_02820 [Acidobacteria bacterium]|nr:hypothetical protein [Acidobacteriota bacterium]